jgi:hypothetical protein
LPLRNKVKEFFGASSCKISSEWTLEKTEEVTAIGFKTENQSGEGRVDVLQL